MKRPKLRKFHLGIHSIIIFVGWAIYIYALRFLIHIPARGYETLKIALTLEGIFLACLSAWWVWSHLRIHRKFKRRKNITPALWSYEKDWLGYEIKANFEVLKQAQVITIICDDEKQYKLFCLESETNG